MVTIDYLNNRLLEQMNEEKNKKQFDLEERLIDFAVQIIHLTNSMQDNRAANHISGQMLRSGTSPALNYGELRSAESRKDFIHKAKVILKELRETFNALKITKRVPLSNKTESIEVAYSECNELISIFVKSIDTASKGGSGSQ